MIRLQPIEGKYHFVLQADTPVTVEIVMVKDHLVAEVYEGANPSPDKAEPVGAFDSYVENKEWTFWPAKRVRGGTFKPMTWPPKLSRTAAIQAEGRLHRKKQEPRP